MTSLTSSDMLWGACTYLIPLLIVAEVLFYAYFRWILIPHANDTISRRKSQPYRDYPTSQRHVLFLRILKRIEDRCAQTQKSFEGEFSLFLSRWFNGTRNTSSQEPPCSNHFFKEELDVFFSWAFFDKNFEDLNAVEKQEMNRLYDILKERHGIQYESRSDILPESSAFNNCTSLQSTFLQPKCMTLEPVDPLHRPFIVYLVVGFGKMISYFILRVLGFRRYVAIDKAVDQLSLSQQLVYWFKPASKESSQLETILFFHGIAPAGLLFYIPLLYNTFCNHALRSSENNIFLFQNENITCSMSFDALSEESTVSCIQSILEKHGILGSATSTAEIQDSRLCLIGHSFGSCQISWLLYCPFIRPHIRKILLLDPVSILLSEPDVMNNFLYNRTYHSFHSNGPTSLSLRKLLIRLVASSELFTEHYLRRHFSWYNSELWLDDVPENIEMSIYLSERDDIVNAKKIQEEIEIIHSKQPKKTTQIRSFCWKDAGHASCLTNPKLWQDIINGWHPSIHSKQE